MKKFKLVFLVLFFLSSIAWLALLFIEEAPIPVLDPRGWVGVKERDLIVISTLLMLIVIIPVFILTWWITWKYRASNTKAKYDPKWDHSHLAETIWWSVPCAIIVVLGILTWESCHELDPFHPLDAKSIQTTEKPIEIQVVALQWRWLFIYPEQKIASMNLVQFPAKRPVHFQITADAPMNSFWIPQLGGQIYAMPGMKTQLHLIADEAGSFRGTSANLSGEGFARMNFVAKSTSPEEFSAWVESVRQSGNVLEWAGYTKLVEPSSDRNVFLYSLGEEGLYDRIIMKYMMP
ncbi:MAG: ubiquinol oxidase subunit II [Verrucomicrobiota bacterium]|nr:ubiquinol oxidase subunit II [Verrucomicrobiota bacterium]